MIQRYKKLIIKIIIWIISRYYSVYYYVTNGSRQIRIMIHKADHKKSELFQFFMTGRQCYPGFHMKKIREKTI